MNLHSNTRITDIDRRVFNLPSLRELFLGANDISVVRSDSLSNMPKLEWISLDDNKIYLVESGALSMLPNLKSKCRPCIQSQGPLLEYFLRTPPTYIFSGCTLHNYILGPPWGSFPLHFHFHFPFCPLLRISNGTASKRRNATPGSENALNPKHWVHWSNKSLAVNCTC